VAQPAIKGLSESEFFEFLQSQNERWELVDGQPVMMAGANQRHQAVVANTAGSLFGQLRGSKCRPTTADTAVSLPGGSIRYPDIVVDCGPRNDESLVATMPTVVIEVLSRSTQNFDSQVKVIEYKADPAIRCIVLVNPDDTRSILHRRIETEWEVTIYRDINDVIDLPEIGASLALREIYEGLDFKPKMVVSVVCPNCNAKPCVCGEGSAY
jgi:Uma2 family endonuclease